MAFAGASCGGGGGGGGGGGSIGSTGGTDTTQSGVVAQDRASVTPSPVTAARNSPPGAFAADYLRATTFTSLVVEIDYAQGKPPSSAAVAILQARLEERCNKPDGVTVLVDDAIPTGEFAATLSVDRIAAIEAAHRDTYSNLATKTAAFYVLYVSGASDLDEPSGRILGLAYAGSSIAFFIDAADPGTGSLVTRTEVEATGIVHESGHLLGLVDGGVPEVTLHEDAAHPAHCTTRTCVMFWTVTIDPSLNLLDPTFAEFDAFCAADLEAFGGRSVPLTVAPASLSFRVEAGVCGMDAWRRSLAKTSAK
jgi:hypothetical protein